MLRAWLDQGHGWIVARISFCTWRSTPGFFDPPSGLKTTGTNYYSDPFGATGSVNTFPSKPPAKNIDFDANGFLTWPGKVPARP